MYSGLGREGEDDKPDEEWERPGLDPVLVDLAGWMEAGVGSAGMMDDRAAGLLVGLAAGDRNGGPVQMALALAETLVH